MTELLWTFRSRLIKLVMAKQQDIVVVNKLQKKAAVIDVAIPSDLNVHLSHHIFHHDAH